ncbi:phage antirepressor KilAC domain-containing protein [Fructilactobacillus sanfranciscensis]|uniref:phage antirepressor KilAC domain-containing protein n=1 Tax=Fructilactobacillus sanfranciscensis TaxID=1625 RepID=UPI000CD41DAE|nr:phage antirepressor KilAC domain-containing protein [Fructilactobacillus sanfranciscensis]POH17981.1 hypothetical protein BGL45_06840 [Fructilactobacillus sanfranciscensis]
MDKDTVNAVKRHVDNEDKRVCRIATPSGRQTMTVINESGLYSLILSSKLPTAKKFKRWVTSEVLPSLRNNGAYMTQQAAIDFMQDPRKLAQMLTEFANTKDKLRVAEKENKAMKPKALFADSVASSDGTILIRELAVLLKQNGLNIGEKRLFERLRNDGHLVKRKGSSFNKPTQKSMDMGLFKISEYTYTHNNGKPGIGLTPRVTGKGQRYFVDKYCPRNMELKAI